MLGHHQAKIETDFSHKACCNDASQTLSALNTTKLAAKTCSERVCFYSDALAHSTWISNKVCGKKETVDSIFLKVLPGCDCCEVDDGKLAEDGTTWVMDDKTFECCRGEIVIKVEKPEGHS